LFKLQNTQNILLSKFVLDLCKRQLAKIIDYEAQIVYSVKKLWYGCLEIRDLIPEKARNINRLHSVNKYILTLSLPD